MSWVKEWDTCVFPERVVGKRKKEPAEGEEVLVFRRIIFGYSEAVYLVRVPGRISPTTGKGSYSKDGQVLPY